MYCPSCGTEVSAQNRQCPECGVTLSQDEQGGQGTQPTQGDEHGTGQTPPQQPGSGTQESGQPVSVGGGQPQQSGGGPQQPTQGGRQQPTQGGQQQPGQGGQSGNYQQPTQGSQPGGHQRQGQGAQRGGGTRQGGNQQTTGTATSLLSDLPIVGGVIYGLFSYLISFVVISAFVLLEVEDSDGLGVLPVEDSVDALVALFGWFFYSAHGVQTTDSAGDESINFVEEAYSATLDPIVPKIAYYVVPAVLLLLFGMILASRASMDEPVSRFDSARAGATIAVGYLALTVLGAMTVFSYSGTGGVVTIQPDLGSAVLIMGLVYPVAIGGLAGYLAGG
ncbi:zinc ribbon domain-containing protein [Halorientalis salina]|uniref:zinc ribbon domain-containing protein n=1 Tax=Halorientalis salina TaxID=2932266 RepID=UPI0010ACCFC6|nr:zinc ribbon domain-containing protein [Halorientalis salina]